MQLKTLLNRVEENTRLCLRKALALKAMKEGQERIEVSIRPRKRSKGDLFRLWPTRQHLRPSARAPFWSMCRCGALPSCCCMRCAASIVKSAG